MPTALFTHPACLEHDTGDYHPECVERLRQLLAALDGEDFQALLRLEAPKATSQQILRAHDADHLDFVRDNLPEGDGLAHLDPDTVVSAGSWEAALRSAGAAVGAVDLVMSGKARNAFCATRPPGHHAESRAVLGFCLFNNVAIGAMHAHAAHGARRVAVFDIDVHHGNGTQDIFYSHPHLLYVSTHEDESFPGTGLPEETGVAGNILNVVLPPGAGSETWRAAVTGKVFPALRGFKPDLIMISAGFDAHLQDPMAHMRLATEDFSWVTHEICTLADEVCQGRVVSVLEGGYDLKSLTVSCAAHVTALLEHS
ncbi:MAG TPA: histone deacetylase family protein [Candidatus Sulfotelmatobacter sp.]|jgi:acetoin utilization deacetylase AcuC-like enzyme|nr:histone deacetylase family protein [Candidatus Sulfotelmatobacter sp.]